MASTDSCLALSMNAQVLTISTSAPAGSRVSSWPACWASPSITSESTRFFGHPSETIPIFISDQGTRGTGKTGKTRGLVCGIPLITWKLFQKSPAGAEAEEGRSGENTEKKEKQRRQPGG